ncbi:unnamed protein product [Larinioides sclopetarius]|uniref:Uncharacterized protein n=1 Tax=Larinioides sclopetarius TaxID=280406 RepID=A0AAV1Z182_9ARAC
MFDFSTSYEVLPVKSVWWGKRCHLKENTTALTEASDEGSSSCYQKGRGLIRILIAKEHLMWDNLHTLRNSVVEGKCVLRIEDWANHKINTGWRVHSREKRAFSALFGSKDETEKSDDVQLWDQYTRCVI